MKKFILISFAFVLFSGIICAEQINLFANMTGIDIFVVQDGNPVGGALVKVSGNGFCEEKYTSAGGKCRIQVPLDGNYNFCAYKGNNGDAKTVNISGGSTAVFMYLTYGISCTPCNYPQKGDK